MIVLAVIAVSFAIIVIASLLYAKSAEKHLPPSPTSVLERQREEHAIIVKHSACADERKASLERIREIDTQLLRLSDDPDDWDWMGAADEADEKVVDDIIGNDVRIRGDRK